jgi:acetyltransferase
MPVVSTMPCSRLALLQTSGFALEDSPTQGQLASVSFRPIRSEDEVLLEQFGEHLSLNSRYQRFFSPRGFMPGEVHRLTSIDPSREVAVIATIDTACGAEMVGVVRYILDPDTQAAEMAIVLADQWQRRGLGHKLLSLLLDQAAQNGVRVVEGLVLASNSGMQRLAHKLGFGLQHLPRDPGLIQIRKQLQLPH